MYLRLVHKKDNERYFMTNDFGLIAMDFSDEVRRWYIVEPQVHTKDYEITKRYEYLRSPSNNELLNKELNKLYPNL